MNSPGITLAPMGKRGADLGGCRRLLRGGLRSPFPILRAMMGLRVLNAHGPGYYSFPVGSGGGVAGFG